jgi:hypothetical protein
MISANFDKNSDDDVKSLLAAEPYKIKPLIEEQTSLTIDFPHWMIEALEREGGKTGLSKQTIIKMWLAERLEGVVVPKQSGF